MLKLGIRKISTFLVFAFLISMVVMSPTIAQAAPRDYKVTAGYGTVDIAITNEGYVKADVTSMDLYNTDLTIFNIAPDADMYANLHSLGVSVGVDQNEFIIALEYKGNVKGNTTVTSWATSIRDKVKSYFALTYSNEQFLSAYSDSNNATDFTWTYTVTCTNDVMMNLANNISTSIMQSTFVKFYKFTSGWTVKTLAFWFTKNMYEVNATGMSFIDVMAKKLVFSGDGTHIFNLTDIFGYSVAPSGVSYAVTIGLPYDAVLNESTIDAGNATISAGSESITVFAGDNQYVGDLTFAFKYNFTQSSSRNTPENNTSNNNTSNNTSSGNGAPQGTEAINNIIGMMGGTNAIAIIGVATIAVVAGIVKVLLRKK